MLRKFASAVTCAALLTQFFAKDIEPNEIESGAQSAHLCFSSADAKRLAARQCEHNEGSGLRYSVQCVEPMPGLGCGLSFISLQWRLFLSVAKTFRASDANRILNSEYSSA